MLNLNSKKLSLTLLILILIPAMLSASEFIAKDGMIIPGADSVLDDLYMFGNYSEVYGFVDGDIAAFCYDIKSEGEIIGNADLFAYNLELSGNVEKSCRLFGYRIDISAKIGRNVLAFGRRIDINSNAIIGRDLNCAGERVIFDGEVAGNANIAGDIVTISGTIDGDLELEGVEISIISPAVIRGDLVYVSKEEAYIDEDVIIEGETEWLQPEDCCEEDEEKDEETSAAGAVFRFLLFFMALVTGMAMILLFRNHTNESAVQLKKRFWHTLAIGFLAWIIFFGGSLILLVLIVGIPLSILLVTVGMVLFYIGKIYVSIFLGRLLVSLFGRDKKIALGWELLIGLIILSLVFQIPGLGTAVYILTFILGTGAAIAGYLALSHKTKEATAIS